jgi:hypothetical protein
MHATWRRHVDDAVVGWIDFNGLDAGVGGQRHVTPGCASIVAVQEPGPGGCQERAARWRKESLYRLGRAKLLPGASLDCPNG